MTEKLSSSNMNEYINNYQFDINLLKFRIQELEICLGNQNNDKIEQVKEQKNQPNKRKSTKKVKKSQNQANQKNIPFSEKVKKYQAMISMNMSLAEENKILKAEIEKRNSIIDQHETSIQILSNQNIILKKEIKLLKDINDRLNKKEDNQKQNNNNNNIEERACKEKTNINISNKNIFAEMLNELNESNNNLCTTIKYQKEKLDHLRTENNNMKKLIKNDERNDENNEKYNDKLHLMEIQMKRIEQEKESLHDIIDQNEYTIEQLKKEIEYLKKTNQTKKNINKENQPSFNKNLTNSNFKEEQDSQILAKNEDINYIRLNPVKITSEKHQLTNSDEKDAILFPVNKNNGNNINININLQINKKGTSFVNEYYTDEIEMNEEEDFLQDH